MNQTKIRTNKWQWKRYISCSLHKTSYKNQVNKVRVHFHEHSRFGFSKCYCCHKRRSLVYAVWRYLKQALNPFDLDTVKSMFDSFTSWFMLISYIIRRVYITLFGRHFKSLPRLLWVSVLVPPMSAHRLLLELHLFWRVSFSIKPALHKVKFKHQSSVRHVGSSAAFQEEEEEEEESVRVEASERSVSCCPHCFHCIMTSSLLAVWPFCDSHCWIAESRDYRDITQCVHVCAYTQTCGLVEHWVQARC